MVKLPDASEIVLRAVLERRAAAHPDDVAVTFDTGESWTNAQALSETYRAANALAAQGVHQHDHVGIFLWNGPEFLRAWWGATALGAAIATYNVSYRGGILEHALGLGRPKVLVSNGELAERATQTGNCPPIIDPADLAVGSDAAPELDRPSELWDIHCVTMTSGTTGPSKASLTTYLGLYRTGSFYTVESGLNEKDVCLVDLPLFHQAGLSFSSTALAAGCSLAVRPAPDITNYWKVIKETGATMSFVLGAMPGFLLDKPVSPEEKNHNLRYMMMSPAPADPHLWFDRYGITDYLTGYGATEVSGCIIRLPGQPTALGSIGRQRTGYDLRLVDEHDIEVEPGAIGELIVRTDEPWSMSAGYIDDPVATAKAWRNGWWHTGDLMYCDADGNFFFHDRLKDAVRRRGENVSTFEVEREVISYPAVKDVACVAADIGEGEQEVKVWIVPEKGVEVVFTDLVEYLVERMPHFMVPRFYELTDVLPRTESMRVRKHLLRERGNTDSTWDLSAIGWRVTRKGLVK